jgi:hypothetical protein
VKKRILYSLIIVILFLLVIYVISGLTIRKTVNSIIADAILEYPGDNIEALMAYVRSENHNLKEKNRAIWALGQLGDARALPLLEELYTGKPCNHDRYLCQHEIKKAIKLCRGSFNITALLWRDDHSIGSKFR